MSDLLSVKTAVEIGVSAVVLGAFYTYWPGNFYYILLVVSASWIGYLINREKPKNPVLSPTEWKKFPLTHKTRISHNVSLYRFALPNPDDILGLPVGQHISVQAEIDGKTVQRSYTPTSSDDDCGYFELLIKTYPNGLISTYVDQLEIGQPLTVKGPKGAFKYQPDLVRALGMIAGGTGITPMLQIIRAILKDPADETQVNLIFANVNFEDILLKDELDALAKDHENFNVYYVLNNPPEGWTGGTGYVTDKLIKEHCPAPAPDVKILLCGPPPMVTAMGKNCELLGYDKPRALSKLEDQVFKF